MNFIKFIIGGLQRFFLMILTKLKLVISYFSRWEKSLILFLLMVVFISAGLLWRQKYLSNIKLEPTYGGTYIEGVVATSASDLKPVINYLTKVGLVAFDKDEKIIPALAESWETSDDQKIYTFHLRDSVNPQEISAVIKGEKPELNDVEIKTTEEGSIQFILPQPFSPFLANMTEHLFSYGPYKIKSEGKQEIIFEAREDYFLSKAYISEIKIKIYPNENNLSKALKNKEVDAIAEVISQDSLPPDFTIYSFQLPRWQVLFFNLDSEVFRDNKEIRKKFRDNQDIGQTVNLRLLTSGSEKNLVRAQELKDRWGKIGVNIEIITKDSKELQVTSIPAKDYDLLLYGIDYGVDPDSYPFWHSSQLVSNGLNLSNFSSVPADKILEEARQTQDSGKRQDLYGKLQQILDDEIPAIFLSQDSCGYAISNKIKGITTEHQGITCEDRYFAVEKWFIKEKRVKK